MCNVAIDEAYWLNVLKNGAPTWTRQGISKTNRLIFEVLLRADSRTIATVAENNFLDTESLYLENTFGEDLDYEGFVLSLPRRILDGVPEEDDVYRERIRNFWGNSDSSVLSQLLNEAYGDYGFFNVLEVPYTFSAMDNQIVGAFASRNFFILPVEGASNVGLFPTESRTYNNAIVIFVEVLPTAPGPISGIADGVLKLIADEKPFGVVSYFVAWEPPAAVPFF